VSKLNDIDRDFCEAFDNKPYYGGVANSFHYTHKKLPGYIKSQLKEGLDYTEVWNLDITIATFLVPRLRILRDTYHGYSSLLTDEKWLRTLNKMVNGFELYIENKYKCLTSNKLTNKENQAIRLLSLFFRHLWD
jgi:hypothetical protein